MPWTCWLGPTTSEIDGRMRDPGTTARHNSGPRLRTLRSVVACSFRPANDGVAEGKRTPPPAQALTSSLLGTAGLTLPQMSALCHSYAAGVSGGKTPRYAIKEEWQGELRFYVSGWDAPAPTTSAISAFSFYTREHNRSFLICFAHCGLLQKLASSHPPSTNSRLPSNPCTSSPPLPSWILAGQAGPVQVPQRGCLALSADTWLALVLTSLHGLLQLIFREHFELD